MSDPYTKLRKKATLSLPFGSEELGEILQRYRPWARIYVRQQLFGALERRLNESDIIQITTFEIVKNLNQFKGESEAEFFAWFKTALSNHVKDVLRKHLAQKRDIRRETDSHALQGPQNCEDQSPVCQEDSPSRSYLKRESAIRLAALLEQLPVNQRRALELKYLQGMSLSAVSMHMNKSSDAVVALVRRGIKTLKAEMDKKDL